MIRFDPRVKLLVLLLINITIFVSPDTHTEWLCIGVITFLLLLMGCWRQILRGLLIYAGMMGALYLCGLADNFLAAFVSMTVICFRKIMPIAYFASGMMATTKGSELVSAMQKMHIPKVIVIPFTVTLRFFPTAKEEYSAIRDAARLRGLRFSVERTLIPMMLRSVNIAEELSAASVTRGIESTQKRTSMRELRLRIVDFGAAAAFAALTIFTCFGGVPLIYG